MTHARSARAFLLATLAAGFVATVLACGSEAGDGDGTAAPTVDGGKTGKTKDAAANAPEPDEDAGDDGEDAKEDDAGSAGDDGGLEEAGVDSGDDAAGTCSWPATQARVVISQIYGGGGNTDSSYKNDFVELYNRSDAPVSLAGWSLQYASNVGAFPANAPPPQDGMMPLGGTIPAHGHYLVKAAQGLGGAMDLPAADATAANALIGETNGKLALVRTTTALGAVTNANLADPTFRSSKAIEDFVGYGTAATYEGTKAVGFLTETMAGRRKDVCVDTNDNGADFEKVTAAPRNSSTAGPACACPK